jgi:hypothetical protein
MTDTTDTNVQGTAPQGQATPTAERWQLRVRGPVLTDIKDGEGRHIGPIREKVLDFLKRSHDGKEAETYSIRQAEEEEEEHEQDKRRIRQIPDFPTLFEVSIPGVTYNPGRTFSWVSLSQPGIYKFQLLGRTAGTVDIYWTGFSDTTRLNTTFFHAIPITAGDLVSFDYDTFHPSTLTVTFTNSAGTESKVIQPTAILDPMASRDETPPITSITLRENEALVSATDGPDGSGVLYTLYTTDLRTFTKHTPPFSATIPPDARLVMAFSVDRNGNREYPGAVIPVLGLSQTHFVFQATEGSQQVVSQHLKIVNLDPVPLTGPLDWVASVQAGSWLIVEPQAGKTPSIVTLSVNISGLKPGTYTGLLEISSTRREVAFAQQMVQVELLVEANPNPPTVIP